MWQALETKARFISQVITGENAARRAEDIGGQELSYAEVKAIASGNPAVLTLAEADAELQRLTILKKNHADEQYLARRSLRTLPDHISTLSERLANLTADQAKVAAHRGDILVIGDRAAFRGDALDILGARLDALPEFVQQSRRVPLGMYRGLNFGVVLDPQFAPEVYLEGKMMRRSPLSRDHHGPRAVLNGLERLADGYASQVTTVRQELGIAESQLRDYQSRVGASFPHESYLSRLTGLRDRLKAGLSGAKPEPGAEPMPTVPELAEQIKALKAAHTIEAAPQRTGKHGSSAEEPVTARIKRKRNTTTDAAESSGQPAMPHRASVTTKQVIPPFAPHANPARREVGRVGPRCLARRLFQGTDEFHRASGSFQASSRGNALTIPQNRSSVAANKGEF